MTSYCIAFSKDSTNVENTEFIYSLAQNFYKCFEAFYFTSKQINCRITSVTYTVSLNFSLVRFSFQWIYFLKIHRFKEAHTASTKALHIKSHNQQEILKSGKENSCSTDFCGNESYMIIVCLYIEPEIHLTLLLMCDFVHNFFSVKIQSLYSICYNIPYAFLNSFSALQINKMNY